MKVTPENIVKRHEKFPEGTAQLIEYYANRKVVEHVRRLVSQSSINQTNINSTVIIISEYELWERFEGQSVFSGLDVNEISRLTKDIEQ